MIYRIFCCTCVQFHAVVEMQLYHEQVNWGNEEMPLLVHYAGCTVCHPPEGKLSEEVCSAFLAWPFQQAAARRHACRTCHNRSAVKIDI
jgi:hypothetical protein